MSEPLRHQDPGASVYDFTDLYWVVCPRCQDSAVVQADADNKFHARVTCHHCGFTRQREENNYNSAPSLPYDGYFRYPLWLKTACCGHELWARNPEHLAFLEQYISAKQRDRSGLNNPAYRNKLLSSRLPDWIKSAKNREQLVKCLRLLREKADTELNR